MSIDKNKRDRDGKPKKQVKRVKRSPSSSSKQNNRNKSNPQNTPGSDHFYNRFKPKKTKEDYRNEKRATKARRDVYYEQKREEEGKSFRQTPESSQKRSSKAKKSERPRVKKYERSAISQQEDQIRLNRFISNAGVCSRRKADELIEAGLISVNGEIVTQLGIKVNPKKDEVRYNGEVLKLEKIVYVLLNKPKDYITTTDDPMERKTVMDLVKHASEERIYPVGRLDRNTTGLLLLTNDGLLADKLAHPRNNISKIYQVELNRPFTQGDFNKMEFGLELEDGFIKPDDIAYISGADKKIVGIQIHSGKNRIVRRMFEYLDYEIEKLDRTVYGTLTKKDLPRGKWRYLTDLELSKLKSIIKE